MHGSDAQSGSEPRGEAGSSPPPDASSSTTPDAPAAAARPLDLIVEGIVPGTADGPPEQRKSRIVWALVACVVTAVSAWLFAFTLDYFSAEQTTRRAMEVEENVDREGDPFTVSVRKEAIELPSAYVLDHPLSPQEERQLMSIDLDKTHLDEVEKLVASVDGHRLDGPGLYESDGYVETWLMDFFSDRQAGLAVTGLRARDLECRPAAARTVILVVYEGGGAYDGIHFDLSRPRTPLALDPGDNLGKPYFSHKKIDLGNGATPGGLRAEVSPGIEDCSFLFEAEYRDAKGTHQRKIDHDGRRFQVRGIPAEPEQVYVVTIEGVVDCGEKPWPKLDDCPRLPFARGNWSHT